MVMVMLLLANPPNPESERNDACESSHRFTLNKNKKKTSKVRSPGRMRLYESAKMSDLTCDMCQNTEYGVWNMEYGIWNMEDGAAKKKKEMMPRLIHRDHLEYQVNRSTGQQVKQSTVQY